MKLSRTQLAKAFVDVLTEANQSQLVADLARQLVESGRADEFLLLVRDIERELLAQRRHLELHVTAAHPLDKPTLSLLEHHFARVTGAKTVHASAETEADLLGGVVAETPDEVWDASLRHKLERLEF